MNKEIFRLTFFALFITVLYLMILVALVVRDWDEFSSPSLNEIGDFVSGSLGPLSIIWLAFGYFLQSSELRQSSQALNLQAIELHNAVTQQRILAEAATQEIVNEINRMAKEQEADEARKKHNSFLFRPRFVADLISSAQPMNKTNFDLTLKNVGMTARDVAVEITNGDKILLKRDLIKINSDSKEFMTFEEDASKNLSKITLQLKIKCLNLEGNDVVSVIDLIAPLENNGFGKFLAKEIKESGI